MKLLRETYYYEPDYIYVAILENKVKIYVRADGSATDDFGNTYYRVSQTDFYDHYDDLGWCSEIDAPIVLTGDSIVNA